MRTSTYKFFGLALLFIWAFAPLNAFVKDQDFAKVIEKSFDIKSDGSVELNNKYGNMAIKTWNKNKVEIRVTIEVSANSEKAAEKLFDKVNIEFDNTSDFVRAVTEIDSKGMSWGSNNKITINYLVNMPETCFLEAANKYGNVDVETLTNGATFNIGYGAISTESISGKTSLELAYSKGRLGSLNDIYVEVKYSELGIEKCSNAMVQSKYSQLRIKEVARLELESKYGDFEIGKVTELINEGKYDVFSIGELGTLSLESSYSDIEIESLAKSISLELKYGNFSLDKVMKGFSEISVEAQYADVKIGMEKGVSMRLNLSGKYIDVNVPDSFVTTTDDKDDSRQRQIIGHLESSSGAPVNISMSYGNINIK